MEKRTKLAILIIVALLLVLLGLYLLLRPFVPALQPPGLPSAVKPYVPPPTSASATATGTGISAPVSDVLLALMNEAKATVERVGSGVNTNGFEGYADVLLQMTANGQIAMKAEQQKMQSAHAPTGPLFGISTRAVSASVVSGAAGDATIVISVDAIQRQDAGNPNTPTSVKGKRVSVTFQKQADGSYLIDSVVWTDFNIQ